MDIKEKEILSALKEMHIEMANKVTDLVNGSAEKNCNLIRTKINLNQTVKDELLFAALIQKSDNYKVKISNSDFITVSRNNKQTFTINIEELRDIDFCVSSETGNSGNSNVRICLYRGDDGQGSTANIIVTIDNPYRVKTEGGKYLIEHKKVSDI